MSLLALQDLFRRHRAKENGVWRLGKDPGRTIFLDNGDIVFAQSTYPTDRLTHILVERNKLTQAQLDYAMANLKPGLSIGKNLIDMGFITQRDLLEVARAQVERIVLAALGSADERPEFEAKELEANVVRLPFDSPGMLMNCILGLKDREGLLEVLGPLNQVVVLEGRRLFEINLPLDLAKLPTLLGGGRTLLELARESGAEPLRVGAFALFLREMGWARLHELPPLDRSALDLALRTEPEPLAPPLPLPDDESKPTLIATIKAAERPTTNLEHLSASLDLIAPEFPPVLEESELVPIPDEPSIPAAAPWDIVTGHIEVPTPRMELPEPPEMRPDLPEEEPPLQIQPPAALLEDAPSFEEPPKKFRLPLVLGAAALLGLGLAAGFGWKRYRAARPLPAKVADVKPPTPKAEPPPGVPKEPVKALPKEPETIKVEPSEAPKKEPAPVKAVPAKAVPFAPEDRLAALRGGDIKTALDQGARHLGTLAKADWTLRLEIACQGETLQKAARMLEAKQPDLFLRPMAMRDGRTCYQVFMGHFASKAAAEKAIPGLPAPFHAGGNKPRAFRVDEIPD
jgi:hypothetical protein